MFLYIFNFTNLIYCLWGGFFWCLVPEVCDLYWGPGKVLDSFRPDAGKCTQAHLFEPHFSFQGSDS